MNRTEKKVNEQLKQLALSAQQYPPFTQGRQLALKQLVQIILNSGKLYRPQQGKFVHRYTEIYEEAQQELLFYVCQNIDKYNPERGDVLVWCNVLMERRFFREAIPKVLGKPEIQRMSIVDLENLALPEESPVLADIVKEYIELDSENLFKTTYVKNHPEANFQIIAKYRMEGKSWKEISQEFNIKIATLSSFYQRCLEQFALNIKNATQNI